MKRKITDVEYSLERSSLSGKSENKTFSTVNQLIKLKPLHRLLQITLQVHLLLLNLT